MNDTTLLNQRIKPATNGMAWHGIRTIVLAVALCVAGCGVGADENDPMTDIAAPVEDVQTAQQALCAPAGSACYLGITTCCPGTYCKTLPFGVSGTCTSYF